VKKIILILTLFSSSVFAQSESISEISIISTLKKSGVGISFYDEVKTTTMENKVNGVLNKTLIYLNYKPSPIDLIRITGGFNQGFNNTTTTETAPEPSSIRYKRSKILSEEKNWVNLNSEVRVYMFPTDLRDTRKQDGYFQLNSILSRKIKETFSINLLLIMDQFLRNSSDPKIARSRMTFILDPSIEISDKISFTPEICQTQKFMGNKGRTYTTSFTPTFDYDLSSQASVQLYWDSTPLVSGDTLTLAKNWFENGVLGFNITYKLF
jgi:hypothetical protein